MYFNKSFIFVIISSLFSYQKFFDVIKSYIYIYTINLWTVAALPLANSSEQLRLNEDRE